MKGAECSIRERREFSCTHNVLTPYKLPTTCPKYPLNYSFFSSMQKHWMPKPLLRKKRYQNIRTLPLKITLDQNYSPKKRQMGW